MTNEDYNSGWFGCLVLIVPYVIIGALIFLYCAISNRAM
jgi:hypothetical protein